MKCSLDTPIRIIMERPPIGPIGDQVFIQISNEASPSSDHSFVSKLYSSINNELESL